MMKKILIIALIVLAAGLVLFLVALAAGGFDIGKLNSKEIIRNDYTYDETFHDSIVIATDTSDVRIVTSDTATKTFVTVSADARREQIVKSEGGVLSVEVGSLPWYKSFGISWGKEEITITLPKASQGDISIKATTGDVALRELDAKSITADVTTGDVGVSGVTADDLSIKITTGDVEMERIDLAGALGLEGTTGDISIERSRVLGAVDIKATTGDVDVKLLETQSGINVELTTGDVEMDLESAMNFDVETTTGRKRVPHSDPSAPPCRIKTTTGDISIQYGIDD